MSNFGRLKSENGHFWIDYFQIIGKSLTSISRIWWALRRSSIITKRFCSPLQCLFCKLVQMSNFGRLKSGTFWRLFPNLRQIPKIHQTDMVGIIYKLHSAKNICSPIQCFFCKLVQMSNFGRLKSANEHILDRLFTNLRQFPKIHLTRIWWALLRSSITAKNICSPMQCFFCKLVQMSNFGRLNSANEHILDRLFPNLRQIPKIHQTDMVGII